MERRQTAVELSREFAAFYELIRRAKRRLDEAG
jgi:hypothetical protein